MIITLDVTGLKEARQNLAAIEARMQDMTPALKRAMIIPMASAQGRIRTGGDGAWPPQAVGPHGETNETGSLLYRSGALMRSLTIGAAGNTFVEIPMGVSAGTNLQTEDGYNIGRLMQDGVGPIKPRNGKFLVFEINGKKIFSRGTKGIPARWFLFYSDDDAKRMLISVRTYLEGKDAG